MLFLEKLEQKRIYLIAVMILCILLSVAYGLGFAIKEQIASTSVMLIKIDSKNTTELNGGTLEISKGLVSTYEELVKSDSNLSEIKTKLKLDTSIRKLKECISLEKVSNSDTFKIEVRNEDADIAISLSKEILNNFSEDLKNVNSFTKIYIIDNPHIVGSTYFGVVSSYALKGIVIGLVIDALYILLLVYLDKNAKTGLNLETEVALKTLMTIPCKETSKKKHKDSKAELIAYESEKTEFSKAFKNLRSNIQFVNVNSDTRNIILVTSPNHFDGKSFVAANLAISYAEVGKKVILIDADMRTGRQGKIFNIPNNLGLSNYLSSLDTHGVEINELINKFINETAIKNLNLITSGTIPPNSNELLTSDRLVNMIKDLSVFYDVIIIDGTPILTTTDSLILTRVVSSTLIVTNYKNTKTDDLIKSKKDIQNVGGRIIGVVVNNVKIKNIKESKKAIKDNLGKFKNIIKENFEKIKKVIKEKSNTQKLLEESYDKKEPEAEEKKVSYREKIEELDEKIDEKVEEIEDKVEDTFESIQDKVKGFIEKVTNKFNNKDAQIIEEIIEENEEAKAEEIEKAVKEEYAEAEVSNENVENIEKQEEIEEVEERKFDISEFANRYKEKAADTFDKTKNFFADRFKNKAEKEIVESDNKVETSEKVEIVEEKQIEKPETIEEKIAPKKKRQAEDNDVLVLIDSENGFCRVFSKYCFTEKLVRGVDKTDGIYKGNYSQSLMKARFKYIMESYDLTEKEIKNVDPLVFATLHDYDECMWVEKKMTSNKSEIYVRCMSEKINKEHGESSTEYKIRCQEMRKSALYDSGIEIEYKIDDFLSSRKMNFTDKLIMKKYANLFDDKDLKDKFERSLDEDKLSRIKEFAVDKINGIKNVLGNFKVKQVEVKTVEEIEKEINEDRKEIEGQYKLEDLNNSQDNLSDEEFSKNLKAEYERQKEERKKEAEVLKKIKKEKQEFKKREKLEQKRIKQEAKRVKREELRKNRILEREKQRVEARIEEELMDDNLYPKTKNNKNL